MGIIFMIVTGLIYIVLLLGFLVPQYAAWKNKRYKAVAISLCTLVISIAALVTMIFYGDFVPALLYGAQNSHTSEANEFVLCALAFIWVAGHFFCWWYIYRRKSMDFIHVSGYTADKVEQAVSPEFRKLIGLA